jgi:hypothetical protein
MFIALTRELNESSAGCGRLGSTAVGGLLEVVKVIWKRPITAMHVVHQL